MLSLAWQVLNYWSKPECNLVSGHDPSGLPLNLSKNETVDLFIGELCRNIQLKFETQISTQNEFQVFRYSPIENALNSGNTSFHFLSFFEDFILGFRHWFRIHKNSFSS
jgi:hypothetical protein